MTELLLCLAATGGLFHRQQAVCVKKVVAVQKVAFVKQHYVPYQTLFLVAPPSYYNAPQYAAPTPAPQPTQPAVDAAGVETDKKIIEALSTLTIAVGRLEKRIDAIEGGWPASRARAAWGIGGARTGGGGGPLDTQAKLRALSR